MPQDRFLPPCPCAACRMPARAIRSIGDGWTLLILREALCGVERFDAMHDDLGIPRSVLAERLSKLVAEGILEQRPYRSLAAGSAMAMCSSGERPRAHAGAGRFA